MNIRALASALAFSFVLLFSEVSPATEAEEASLLKDLTSVIMLLGLSCDKVISAEQMADNDHIALCTNGNRYHVFITPEGRVVALKQ